MKNIVYIDVDTEREDAVRIGKTPDFKTPEVPSPEDQEVCQNDIMCMAEGIILIAKHMEKAEYQTLEDTISEIIAQLETGLADNSEPSKDNG